MVPFFSKKRDAREAKFDRWAEMMRQCAVYRPMQ